MPNVNLFLIYTTQTHYRNIEHEKKKSTTNHNCLFLTFPCKYALLYKNILVVHPIPMSVELSQGTSVLLQGTSFIMLEIPLSFSNINWTYSGSKPDTSLSPFVLSQFCKENPISKETFRLKITFSSYIFMANTLYFKKYLIT